MPHALIMSYASHMDENEIAGNPTVEAAKGFDRHIDPAVPRIVLIDTFNREVDDTLATAEAIPLDGVRIDTSGENRIQYSENVNPPKLSVPEKYLYGNGVTIEGVWGLRRRMNEAGHEDAEITVSSGFNSEKTGAFAKANRAHETIHGCPLINAIGTGSLVENITQTTSDIVAYYNKKQDAWVPMSKSGRGERASARLVLM